MLKDVQYKLVYSSGEDEPLEFYVDSLMEGNCLDLGLGYFSSTAFTTLSLGLAYFINRGGRIRILINDVLSVEDKEAILKGQDGSSRNLVEEKIISNLIKFYELLSKRDKHFYNCLSWLIATKKLELKAIVPLGNAGIAHQKFGIFRDETNDSIAFTGSANFSANALLNNLETISCYKSWTSEKSETDRVKYFDSLFQKMWEGRSLNAKLIPLENIKTYISSKFPVNSLEEIILEELNLIEELKMDSRPSISTRIEEIKNRINATNEKPSFPTGKAPKDYQILALEKWQQANYQGFFEMATGTGKTITSLNCTLSLYFSEGICRFLILVPTLTLASQWAEECASFKLKNIIIANSNNPNWVEECLSQVNKSYLFDNSFGIITTYATFALPKFQSLIRRLDSSVIFIADEAHNFGTDRLRKLYPNKFLRRIGLSATPERHFDAEGTLSILKFFNAEKAPTFRLNMKEAIESGYLCEYYYYPKMVSLLDTEQEEYNQISKRLLRYFDAKTGQFQNSPIVTMLLLERKRIIHKAYNKKDCLRECLKQILEERGTLDYTLVYVPEGTDETIDDFDRNLIDEYSKIISQEFNVSQHQFIGGTQDRDDILTRFALGKLSILTAMKCLDEGVDVQRTETAIFCSSTGNPRQFIQRRGRILRLHKDKKNAFIYDMIVIPSFSTITDSSIISMEKSILRSELKRVYEFASLSKNKYQSLKTLEDIASEFNIDIFSSSIA